MTWDSGLAGPARNIAATNERRLRVVAGPGTGKSFAIKRRVARLLEEGQDPSRVLAVTFTRNAAASLVDDLTNLNAPGSDKLKVSTLHSYCFRLLNQEDVLDYLGRTPRPIISLTKSGSLQFEGGVMLSDLASNKAFGDKRARAKRVRAFEAAWARLQSEKPGWSSNPLDQAFEEELLGWLRFHRAMLIGELVPEALRFLRNNPMCNALAAFDHVIVDEYQDLNRAEQEIVDILSEHGSSAIVGDPDQSIYSFFRFANPDGISDYNARHPETYDQSLAKCRRCPDRVVTIASDLIGTNYPPGSPPRLLTMQGNPTGEIHIVQWDDVDQEAKGMSEYVEHLVTKRNYKPNDIMVIAPRRRLGYKLRDEIQNSGISAYSFYQEEALEEEPAQRAFALLNLLAEPEDRVALRWWLGNGGAKDRSPSYKKLRSYCESTSESPRTVLESIDFGILNLPGVSPLVEQYRKLKHEIYRLLNAEPTSLVDTLMPLEDETCAALREVALLSLENSTDVGQMFEKIKTNITQPDLPDGEYVRIMSPQKAKGLTSRVVVVTGCIEGLLPFVDSTLSCQEQNELILEQRRLFYVAITRCTDILALSSFTAIERGLAMNIGAKFQTVSQKHGSTVASRFIGELGPTAPQSQAGPVWRNSGYADPIAGP